MKLKARILLVMVSVMAVMVTSSVFHHCYVIDSLRPDLPENTPPAVDFDKIEPLVYGEILIDLDNISEEEGTTIQEFIIGEIWDPDHEEELHGIYAIDYESGSTATGGRITLTKKDTENGEDNLWEGSFKIDIPSNFDPAKRYEVLAGISDREIGDSEYYFAAQDDTMVVFIKWVVNSFHGG